MEPSWPRGIQAPATRLQAWVAPAPDHPSPWAQARARRISAASLLLAGLWAAAALLTPATYPSVLDETPLAITALLVATPLASGLAYILSRSRFTVAAAVFLASAAAVGTLVVAAYQPMLAAPVSLLFLFASLLVLGCLVLPLPYAAAIASINVLGALAGQRFLPTASDTALQFPYLFLAVNAGLLLVLAPLRHRDEQATHEERQRAAEASLHLQRAQQEAEVLVTAGRTKDETLRTASHEVKTPLTIIMLQLALLRKTSMADFTPAQERSIQVLERNLKRLAALLEDLLDKARLDAGRLPLNPKPLDLRELVEETAEAFEETAAEYGIRIKVEAGPAHTWGDPARLGQVLYNLVGNALKFTPPGGTIRLRAAGTPEGVEAEVWDDGPGLTPEQMAALFQPFSQVHQPEAGRPRGAGLGLAICRGIITRHGGRIWVESDGPGRGSRFRFTLPARPLETQAPAAPEATPQATPAA